MAFGSKPIALTFTPASTNGDITHPVLFCSQGTLSFSGNVITVNNASGTPLSGGTYNLIHQATGHIALNGGFVVIVTGSGLAPGFIGEVVASGGDVNLLVSAYTPKNLVWTGGDINNPNNWDRLVSTNWLNGATPSPFNLYDNVTFNSAGSTNPSVNLAQLLSPGSVKVDTSANDYTFSTTTNGQIAGATGLLKVGTGTLFLNLPNGYSGGTVISNGVIKIGIDEAISSVGAGDVTNISPGIIDLNSFSNTVGALNGNGTVDITSGGVSTLNVGANNNNGAFSGLLTNSSGTLNLTKIGTGTETISGTNGYVGITDIEQGTLKALNPSALGIATPVVMNGGTLDLATNNISIASLAGTGGTIANNSTAAGVTNTLTILGTNAVGAAVGLTQFGGTMVYGSTGGTALKVLGGTLRMLANNTYTGGTIVGSGATLQIHNGPAGVTGPIIASNSATLGLSGGGTTPTATGTIVTTVDGATVTFTSGAEGEIWTGQFAGSATTTNRFVSPQSTGAATSFSNFLGLAQFALASSSVNFRFFDGGGVSGGFNTTFEFDGGNVHNRDAQTTVLGAVQGGSSTCGIGGDATSAALSTWVIGTKNLTNTFEGYISGSNSLVKARFGPADA